MPPPRRKRQGDSESAGESSEGEDYELQAKSYYDTKGCAPLVAKNRDRSQR